MRRILWTAVLVAGAATSVASAHAQVTPADGRGRSHVTLEAFGSSKALVHFFAKRQTLIDQRNAERRAAYVRRYQVPPCAATGQTYGDTVTRAAVVTGRVRSSNGHPLRGANVFVTCAQVSVGTDNRGRFAMRIPGRRLSRIAPVDIRVRSFGYDPRSLPRRLAPGDSIELDVTLPTAANELEGVVVTGAAAGLVGRDAGASITNTQHGGIDEGDIVKLHGRHLVILRRGRLFTVAIGDDALRPVAAIDVFPPGSAPTGGWYDEMLIAGDRIVVTGFTGRGTEIGVFGIDDDGGLEHQDTWYFRSDDYYSSRNYASRLIGNRLILYSPRYVPPRVTDPMALLPAMQRWSRWRARGFEQITTPRRVYRMPLDDPEGIALHTVTSCDLAGRPMSCDATVVIAPPERVFYVGPSAVYVAAARAYDVALTTLVRMPLDGSAPDAISLRGAPVDQFSFREEPDGTLHVVLRDDAAGDRMWRAEYTYGRTWLASIPSDAFGDGTGSLPATLMRPLPALKDDVLHNRFVGGHLLYGAGNGWGRPTTRASTLYVVPLSGQAAVGVPLRYGVDRIEVMGADAVVVGSSGGDLHFTAITLGASVAPAQEYTVARAAQGELRSHGFFYRRDDAESGVIGLPVRDEGARGASHLLQGSAAVVYLRNADHAFQDLGHLDARQGSVADNCRVSCVDWYGNARPIFIGDRVFALLGYELVEGRVTSERIVELQRTHFEPRERVAEVDR